VLCVGSTNEYRVYLARPEHSAIIRKCGGLKAMSLCCLSDVRLISAAQRRKRHIPDLSAHNQADIIAGNGADSRNS